MGGNVRVKNLKVVAIPLLIANGVITAALKMPYKNLAEFRRNNALVTELEKQTQEKMQPFAKEFWASRSLPDDETITPTHPLWGDWLRGQEDIVMEFPKATLQVFSEKELDGAIKEKVLTFNEAKYVEEYLLKK